MSPACCQETKHHLKYTLGNNIIQPSSSPWESPVVFVHKKDGSLQFSVDYQKVRKFSDKEGLLQKPHSTSLQGFQKFEGLFNFRISKKYMMDCYTDTFWMQILVVAIQIGYPSHFSSEVTKELQAAWSCGGTSQTRQDPEPLQWCPWLVSYLCHMQNSRNPSSKMKAQLHPVKGLSYADCCNWHFRATTSDIHGKIYPLGWSLPNTESSGSDCWLNNCF